MRNFILCLLIFLTSPAYAQKPHVIEKIIEKNAEKVASTDPDALPVLQQIKGTNKELSYDYLGNRFGVDAWLLSGPNVMQIIYTIPNSESAIIGGALVGPDGKEISSTLTKDFMTQYPERAQEILITVRKQNPEAKDAKPATSKSEILWQKLEQGGKITFGTNKDAPVIFAILDPVAPATKEVWTHLGPLAKDNKITLNILPLGLTTADSIMDIATTLGDKDPKAAWEKMMAGQPPAKQETPASSGVLGMKANVDLAQSLKLRDLPFIVYRAKDNGIRIIKGIPKDWNIFTK